jgi:hypothetical protein
MDSKTLVLGERLLVTLPGLGAAGYRWAAAIDPPAVVSVERVAVGSGSDDRHAGASRDEAFALTAVAVGEGKCASLRRAVSNPVENHTRCAKCTYGSSRRTISELRLVKLARKTGVDVRKAYTRVGKHALRCCQTKSPRRARGGSFSP